MFKNLKIRGKLLAAFGIVIGLLIIAGAMFFATIGSTESNFESFHDDAFEIAKTTYGMYGMVNNLSSDLCNGIVAPNEEQVNRYITSAKETLSQLSDSVNVVRKTPISEEFSNKANELIGLINEFYSTSDYMFTLCLVMRQEEAREMYIDTFEPLLVEIREIVTAMNNETVLYADSIYAETMGVVNTSKMLLSVICLVALVCTICIALGITKILTKPIEELDQVAKALEQGELKGASELVTYRSKDELGQLGAAMCFSMETLDGYVTEISALLRRLASGDLTITSEEITDYMGDFASIKESMQVILTSFNHTISDIYTAAVQVDVGADQVSSGAQALSQGATEQASAVEQLSATITDVSNHVNGNAQRAVQASKMSDEAGEGVVESNKSMEHLMSAMEEINRTTGEIEKIIKTIEDIAFQTNILALNAAVEAARAGNAGKGFAVVADEVRSLAGKSAEAAKNTNKLIGGTVKAVKNGMDVAEETGRSLNRVVEKTSEVSAQISEIAKLSADQAEMISQISDGIEQIAAVVQNNSATAEQSAAASEELAGQAALMKDLIGKFRLAEESDDVYLPSDESFDTEYVSEYVPEFEPESFVEAGDKY